MSLELQIINNRKIASGSPKKDKIYILYVYVYKFSLRQLCRQNENVMCMRIDRLVLNEIFECDVTVSRNERILGNKHTLNEQKDRNFDLNNE